MARKEPKNEQAICKGLMQLIGERRSESVTPTDQPDVNERNKAAVEWLFETATAQFAIEHTRIESFQNQIADGRQFALMLEPLERELDGRLPSFYFLTVGVGEAKAPVSRHAAIRGILAKGDSPMKAIEVVGTIEEGRRVRLDEPLPLGVGGRVRLIILVGEDEPSEQEWLHAARQGEGFDFLNAPEEDRYTLRDGKPFDDAR